MEEDRGGSMAAKSKDSHELDGGGSTGEINHELVEELRFPMGFRFIPTDEELLDIYLRAKIEDPKKKLDLDVVQEVEILKWEPGKLIEKYKSYGEDTWYFFTVREQSSSKKEFEPSRKVRVEGVKGASWKATGSLKKIFRWRTSDGGTPTKELLGTRRILTYQHKGFPEDGRWSMYEFVMAGKLKELDQYVLCTIQRPQNSDAKKRKRKADTSMQPEKAKRTKKNTSMQPEKAKRIKKNTTSPKKMKKGKKNISSQAQEGQHQQEETTVDAFTNPPPSVNHAQDRGTLHDEDPMDLTSLIPPVDPQGYLEGSRHQIDAFTQPEVRFDRSGDSPLMMQGQGHQTLQEEDYTMPFHDESLSSVVFPHGYPYEVHGQVDASAQMHHAGYLDGVHQLAAPAQLHAGFAEPAQYMPNVQYNAVQVHTQNPLLCGELQQQRLYYSSDHLLSSISSTREQQHTQYQFGPQDSGRQLETQGTGNFSGTSHGTVQLPQVSAKTTELQTSPDSVLEGPMHSHHMPLEDSYLYSNIMNDIIQSGSSSMAQGSGHGSGGQLSPVDQVVTDDSNGHDVAFLLDGLGGQLSPVDQVVTGDPHSHDDASLFDGSCDHLTPVDQVITGDSNGHDDDVSFWMEFL